MMFWNGDGGWADSGGQAVMVLGMLVFWGLIIAAVAVVVRQPDRHDRASGGVVAAHRTAQQMWAERFARGDIGEKEFTSRLATLRDQSRL